MANFKTIHAHTSDLRTLIRQTSDDSIFTDQYLYKKILDARAKLLSQRIKQGQKLGSANKQKLCYELELTGYNDCACIDTGDCDILKTVNTIPNVLRNKYRELITITSMDGIQNIDPAEPDEIKFFANTRTKACKPFWSNVNGKIAIFGYPVSAKSVYITASFYDPIAAIANAQCATSLDPISALPCSTAPEDVDLPLDPEYNDDLYSIILEKLFLTSKVAEDLSNNAESAVSGVTK